MSNLLSIHNSKNQVGIGTNNISVSSSLTIKEDSKRYIVFNTGNDSIDTHRPIELEDETTLSTVKTNSISSPKLLYISSNNEISSLAFSSSKLAYLRMSNSGGLSLVDKTAPIVQSISATNGTYGFTSPNNIIDITVTFNETVTKTGTPSLTLSNNATASYNSGDNSTSIVFRYTIKQSDSDYSSLSVSSLSGTIQDLSGHSCTSISGTLGSVHVDTTVPTMTITSTTSGVTDGSTTNDATIVLKFEASKATTNFVEGDITVTNGTIGTTFASTSLTVYTATFTPSGSGARTKVCAIDVAGGAFTNAAGNNNTAATQFNWTHDSLGPGPPSVTWPSSGNNSVVNVSLTGDGITWDYSTNSGVSYQTGSGSSFSLTSGTVYAANSIYVRQWDAAGNSSSSVALNSSEIIYSGFATSDIRHWFWIQNQTQVTAIRGYVGYVEIKGSNQSGAGWSDRIAFTRDNSNTTVYSGPFGTDWSNTVNWPTSQSNPYNYPNDDNAIWKCTFNSSTNVWQIENTNHPSNVAIGYWGNGWSATSNTTYHIEHDTNTSSTSANGGEWKLKELSTNTYVEFWASYSGPIGNYGYIRTGASASGTNKSTSFRIICH
tara:strand:- start:109 stop:1917 length:1809 start_codon:yes stop_codon:yes gene_type:complete